MNVLVTGATGVLGLRLTRALVERGDDVVVLSRTPDHLGALSAVRIGGSFHYSPEGALAATLSQGAFDAVVHAACAYGRDGDGSAALADANVEVPMHIFRALRNRVRHFVNLGTALPRVVSHYAETKHRFQDWLDSCSANEYPARTTASLHLFYGPDNRDSSLVSRVVRACLSCESVPLTSGEQMRDLVFIDDVVRAILCIVDNPPERGHRITSVGTGVSYPVRDVALRIRDAVGCGDLCFGAVPPRELEPTHCVGDPRNLLSLGWSPRVGLDEGIVSVIEAERERRSHS